MFVHVIRYLDFLFLFVLCFVFFFFSSRRRHTRCSRDWSSDVCSSDLPRTGASRSRSRPTGRGTSGPRSSRSPKRAAGRCTSCTRPRGAWRTCSSSSPRAQPSSEMNAIRTIARRELKALFDQPTAYILLVVFTGLNAYLSWPQVEGYHTASLRPMLDLLPWLLLVLVSAVTMRALAEDTRAGTLEVVLAQPITELELLVGKYAGQVLFLLIALALTLTIPLGLALGAKLEVGVLIAQYLGAALLVAGLAAVGVWASSVTRNQITALIVAAAVTFVLIFVGYDALVVGLPPRLGAIAASLGVLSHFTGIARGVIDLRDAIYFVTLAALFLVVAYFALLSRKLTPRGEPLRRLRLGTEIGRASCRERV